MKRVLFHDKNINRTSLHDFKNGTRGHKICTFLHEWLARSAKKCKFYAQGCHFWKGVQKSPI